MHLYSFLKNKLFQYLCVIEICIFSTITSDVKIHIFILLSVSYVFWIIDVFPIVGFKR